MVATTTVLTFVCKYRTRVIFFSLQVHLCEAVHIQDVIGDDFLLNRMSKRPMLVAVKVLCKSASHKSR